MLMRHRAALLSLIVLAFEISGAQGRILGLFRWSTGPTPFESRRPAEHVWKLESNG